MTLDSTNDYALIDSGNGEKLERFGRYMLRRPCSQAVWNPKDGKDAWRKADASFDRKEGNRWHNRSSLPNEWTVSIDGIQMKLSGTDFGHLGVFPEQRHQWNWIRQTIEGSSRQLSVLNLFAYSGGSTLAAALAGAKVCHLDASKGMVEWARGNARLNNLDDAPIRWIVDDVHKFLNRELRRGNRYDGIILDPPSFGRGKQGEVYKIEQDVGETLDLCRQLLTEDPTFFLLSAHTPGFSPIVLENLVKERMYSFSGAMECGEMLLTGDDGAYPLPNGNYARWRATR